MNNTYDVVIIGGGVVGSSKYKLRTCVLEKELDVCLETSGRNSGVLHAGFNNKVGSLMAKFCVEGNQNFDEVAKELDIPFKRTGKLVVGFTEEDKEKLIKIRSITPVDHFSSKAKVPLQYEYTMETFSTELIINNAKLQDLQGIFFVIRDSWNKEIRIGNSKTRGFGLIKFEIEDLIYEQFKSKDDDFRALEDFFEEKHNEEEKLIKFTFSKRLYLKKDFKKLYDKDGASNKFIISLFKGGEN